MYPPRSSSRWLGAPASAGSSRSVGMCMVDQRTLYSVLSRLPARNRMYMGDVRTGLEKSREVQVPQVGVYRRPAGPPDQYSRLGTTQILGGFPLRDNRLSRENRAGQPGADPNLQGSEQQGGGDGNP